MFGIKVAARLLLAALTSLGGISAAAATVQESARVAMHTLMEDYHLPSLSLAIGSGDSVVFAEALGYASLEEERPATPRTQYSVASVAKPMTAIALAKLVDAGHVELEAPVAAYVDQPPYTRRFSVRELAAHLAGIPHDTPERQDAEFLHPRDHANPVAALDLFAAQALLFEPGTDVHYSSNGYILLSALIEQVAEPGFTGFLKTAIWPALGMADTEADVSTAGGVQEARYYASYDEEAGHGAADPRRDRSFLFGGGGFLSTPSDMVSLARATYDTDFLSSDIRRAMYAPTPLRDGEDNPEGYSLGWRVGSMRLGSETQWITLEHPGLMEGAATAYLLVIPECQQSIAFATNFVPPRFWELYGKMAALLRQSIDESRCEKLAPRS